MSEIVADLLHRQAVVKQMLRRRVAQRMRTATLAGDAEAASDDVRYRTPTQRTDRGLQCEEQHPLGTRGTKLAYIAQDGLSDAAGERIVMRASRLRAAHPQRLLLPVQIVEPQTGDLAGAKAIGDQHHQDGAVAQIGRPAALGGCEQAQDLVPVQPLRDRLPAMEPRRQDPVGQPGCAPALAFGEPEEGAKTLRVMVDRDPAELHWQPLTYPRVLEVLHNPRYAGAFAFGRHQTRRLPDGRTEVRRLARDQWTVLLPDTHPGYISWDTYEANHRRLAENARAYGGDRRCSPPREGPALLQGLAVCGVCGCRMTVRYVSRREHRLPVYMCQREGINTASPKCQAIPGVDLDQVIGRLLVELVTPVTMEVALRVQDELEARADEVATWRNQQVQRAREEADLARVRYMRTDPNHRMVADVLEAEWNARLRALDQAHRELERRSADENPTLDQHQRDRIVALATDFPRLWNDPATPDRERKRMARLLIEDVTLTRGEAIAVGIRLRGGVLRQMTVPLRLCAWERYRTPDKALAEMNELLDHYPETEVAAILNEHGHRTGYGGVFHPQRVRALCRDNGLKSHYERLRARGLLSIEELARHLGVSTATVKTWRRRGLLRGQVYNRRNEYLYEMPSRPPIKFKHKPGGRQEPVEPQVAPEH